MSDKYYRVKKDTPALQKGAILVRRTGCSSYTTLNDLYTTPAVESEVDQYWTAYTIEHATEWYERVYPVNLLTKTVYKVKEEARALFEKEFTDKEK